MITAQQSTMIKANQNGKNPLSGPFDPHPKPSLIESEITMMPRRINTDAVMSSAKRMAIFCGSFRPVLRALAYPYVAERSSNERTRSPLRGRLNEYAYCLSSFDARDGLYQIFRYTRLKRPSFPCSQCRGGEYNNGDAGRCRILFEYHITVHRVHIWKV